MFQAVVSAVQVEVVAEARLQAQTLGPGLCRIDFPGVEIEDTGLPLQLIDSAQRPAGKRIGKQPEPASATAIEIPPGEGHRRDRHFKQPTLRNLEGKTRSIRYAVVVVAHRHNTRAVQVAGLRQLIPGPGLAGTDGITCGAIALHRLTTYVFQQFARTGDILAKYRRCLTANPSVLPAVTGQFMAIVDDFSGQLRVALGDPAQSEKRASHVVGGEQLENALGISLYPAGMLIPLVAIQMRLERGNLEIVFHVDRHGIGHGR